MNPGQISVSAAVLLWVNILPYLSRLPRGLDWVAQYLPDEGFLVPGLIFFHALYSTAAIPLIRHLYRGEKPGPVWALALLAETAFIWFWNKDYDLAADAQAATGLVLFPLIAMGIGFGMLAVGRKLRSRA